MLNELLFDVLISHLIYQMFENSNGEEIIVFFNFVCYFEFFI